MVVTYTLTLTVSRAVYADYNETEDASAAWMVGKDAKRELEREVIKTLHRLDGDCDCEVMDATIEEEK